MNPSEKIEKQESQESQVFNIDSSALQELRNKAKEKSIKPNKWVQRGPYLVGITDNSEIGLYIGANRILKGFDKKGDPILVNI